MINFADAFPASDKIYLLSHSIGRMPSSTQQAVQDNFYRHWQSDQIDIWDHWLDTIADFRSALAKLFNAQADYFCPQTNISSGLTKLIQSLPPKPGKSKILMCEADFPSAGFVLQHAKASDLGIEMLSYDADVQNIDTWEQALTEHVHTVFITHVQYGSSKRAPVKEICELAKQRGVNTIVDIAQSAGVVPIDISDWGCDAVVGSCIKWLCGGPGAGFLFVNSEFVGRLQPNDVGWFSHENPFEFDIKHFKYADDSARFWGGTPSVQPFVAATNSINLINAIGVHQIQQHNQMLIDQLSAGLASSQQISPNSNELRGGTLVLNFANRNAVEKSLKAAGVCYDSRASGLRFSPHIYNSSAEIDKTKACFNA